MTDEGTFWSQFSSDEGEGFRADPDKVRKVDLRQEPRGEGREGVRVTVESARGRIKVFTAPKALLARVIEELYHAETKSEEGFGE